MLYSDKRKKTKVEWNQNKKLVYKSKVHRYYYLVAQNSWYIVDGWLETQVMLLN